MKARAVIFTHVQRPTTIFGMPPLMVGLVAGAAFLVWEFSLLTGLGLLAPLFMAIVAGSGLYLCFRLSRNDHHVETVLLGTMRFWGTARYKALLAGAAPSTRRTKGGRS